MEGVSGVGAHVHTFDDIDLTVGRPVRTDGPEGRPLHIS